MSQEDEAGMRALDEETLALFDLLLKTTLGALPSPVYVN